VALGVMSLTWMTAVAVVVVFQKLVRPILAVDVLLGLAIVGLGILVIFGPSSVPGLTPSM
jgi:predicted metal-binding membrane protein